MLKIGINNKKAAALYIVLFTVMIVVILANVILSTMVSQSRLTHHQVSRIQAYYASMAGINYALEMLRTGAWSVGSNCRRSDGGCALPEISSSSNTFPRSINSVTIFIDPPGIENCNPPAGVQACIRTTTDYTNQ